MMRLGACTTAFVIAAASLCHPAKVAATNMTPVNVTGFNLDLVVESTASGPPYSTNAVEFRPGENLAYYQAGLPGKSFGLPTTGSFTSAVGDGTEFQLQPYTGNNALVLSSATGLSEGTLTLTAPDTYARLAVVANSAAGGGPATLTLNFTDGSTCTTTYSAPDWFNNPGYALQGFERINLATGATSGATTNPRFYQTTLDLTTLLAGTNKPVASITFGKAASAASTGIYAVSGEIAPPTPAVILASPTNLAVDENNTAVFSAVAGGVPKPALQWLRNGVPVAGATNSTYTFQAALADHNAILRLVAANVVGGSSHGVTSAPATLTVIADTNRPVLLSAQSLGLNQVLARFSERLKSTATNTVNFSLSSGVSIFNAALDASQSNVVLLVSGMTDNAFYTLTVNNVADQAAAANIVTNNSQAAFFASVYASVAIGDAAQGMQVPAGNGLNISGGGSDVGGTNDQCQFSHVTRTGDFDVKVRLNSLSLADAWSEAGLVARDSLASGASSASVMATPSISGCYFQARGASNGVTALSGSFPVNFPNTWLRLRRTGNNFTGYAGIDGQNWVQLGTANLALPSTIYFGFAVASHNASQFTTAGFRDLENVTNAGVPAGVPFEPPSQSSRRTSLVISEILYHPTNSALEFIEIFNTRGEPADLSGFKLRGSADYNFPPGTMLPGGGFLVVAKSPVDLENTYGITGVLGPFAGGLPNDRGTVKLLNQAGGVFLQVDYADEAPWPVAADAGHSLVLRHASFGESDPHAWVASDTIGGSPGRLDSFTPDPLRNLVINEFLAHTDDPELDYIELYNHSTQAVSIAGCVLTDDGALDKFVIPGGTTIPANGFIAFDQATLGFSLAADGETLFFKNAARTRIIDAVRFTGQENGVAMGRSPDGTEQFYRLVAKTPGTNNAAIRISDVVINELMYHPISDADADQFIELYNRKGSAVDLSGWSLDGGVSYMFPPGATIAGNGYVVVANRRAEFLTNYPSISPAIVFGNFGGNLSSRGERVSLRMPESLVETNGSVVATNFFNIVMDEVSYGTGGRWPGWADGGGSSLERIDPRANARLPSNWADSDETWKAPWTMVSATGTIDNGTVPADQLQVLLMGAGECLIDNVQVLSNGVNLIANSTFETDASGWTAEGTESGSGWEGGHGYGSARSYHVRAVGRGDNQVNRIRTPLAAPLMSGTTNVTIQAAVRWLKGDSKLLLRLRGNWLECAGEMALPVNAGTPGARNSRYVTNAPPAITDVAHSPVLPAAGQAFVVTARVHDPDGIVSLQLKYRFDPSPTYSTLAMNDGGTSGDAVEKDGIYTATIPGQPGGTMLAFYVQATDGYSPSASATFPKDAPARECLVRVGEFQPTGNFPTYRLWMTQATLNTWSSRHELDNSPFDVTFVLDDKRVVYNAQASYAGSPYIAPGYIGPAAGRCGYSLEFPADDLFLGDADLVLDWPGGHGSETTAMQEQMGYWIADRLNIAHSHRYTIRLHVNGVTDTARQAVFEAAMQPGGAYLEEWMPDDPDGQFYKVERAFEFDDAGSMTADPQPRLQNYVTTGNAKKREKYRWFFMPRSGSAANDYTGMFALVDALNATSPEPYTSATVGLVDVEQWMRVFATEHIIVNFDAYGHEIGKNMYAYKPANGRWQLYMFDLDWLMLAAVTHNSSYAPATAPLFNVEDPTIAAMYAHPPFTRAYWRTIEDAVNGPLNAVSCNPVMDAKYRSLIENGIMWCDNQPLTDPSAVKNWFSQRRAGLQTQLASIAAPFSVNAGSTISNGVANISGTAPIRVGTIAVNGQAWTVRWLSVSNWTATVPLQPGTNNFSITCLDPDGESIVGMSNSVSVVYGGATPSPVNAVVINEIMYSPSLPDAEYVELFNTAANDAFDLSGWQLNGLDYTFPGGSFIAPLSYLVLAKDPTRFHTAYGSGVTVFDAFGGNQQTGGETISLLKPGPATNEVTVVDRVRYEAVAPWPVHVQGASLQLRDAAQDNSRVANWSAVSNSSSPASLLLLDYPAVWKFMQVSNLDGIAWTAAAFHDASWPSGPGLLAFESNPAITNLVKTALLSPTVATNNVTSGHAYYFRTKLNITNSLSGYTITAKAYVDDGAVFYVNGSEVARVRVAAGTVTNLTLSTGQPPGGDALSPDTFNIAPSYFVPGTNVIAVEVHQNVVGSSDVTFGLRLDATNTSGAGTLALATPGAPNSVPATLSAFPPVWLNEVQADNLTGPLDNFSQREPWVEIYNAGTNALNLSGWSLSDNYTNLAQWSFASNVSVPAGGFLVVWCDNQTNQSTAGALHASFRPASGSGRVALSRPAGGTNQIVDYLTYSNLAANWSYGDLPDGQPFNRASMFFATPGGTNNGASPPITVIINEWMADNLQTLADPADGGFEDWFELYNPGTNAVDVGGYYLTDALANKSKFLIPASGHYLVPPGGFLLVWADDEVDQNSTNRADLHVNFGLSKAGEAIGLFAADGTQIDAVMFGAQTSDESQGRFPDGSPAIYFMPTTTPRTTNALPNTVPALMPIPNHEVTLGQTLTFTASAVDTDIPVQVLLFNLGADAPAGADIAPVTGAFNWKPVSAPSTNTVSIIVTDNGTPSLSATQTFSVVVHLPPTISALASGGLLHLSWPRGSLQEADNVTGPYTDVTSVSPLVVDFSESRKFYRIRL